MIETYEKKNTLIKLSGVSLSFGSRQILRDVNIEIKDIVRPGMVQGQVIGLLGPSGVGKSQLSRIIAGLQKPTSGTVMIGSPGAPARKGLVGMVDQSYILFNWTTVLDNLLIAGRQSGLDHQAAAEKANGFIEEFGLGEYVKLYPRQLSGGTRQRVAICQQLMCASHFLIMDEPFSGLDLIMKRRACDLIRKIANLDELNTIIVVTHNVAEAASIADTLWLLGNEQVEGKFIPGARIVEEYDLAAMGLCWHPEITETTEFCGFVHEVEKRFETLKQFT